MAKKKGPTGNCDGRALNVFRISKQAQDSAPITELQSAFLHRRFGILPTRAALIACLVFGEARQ